MNRSWFLSALILFLLPGHSFAQMTDPVLDKAMEVWSRYSDHHKAPGLFLHLDKSVYEHTEHIQFTAYLLGGGSDTANLYSLYVALTNPATGVLETSARFALYRGISTGALYLPDTLNAGEYLVTAYTDHRLEGLDQPLFRQQITLLPDQAPHFILEQEPDSFPLKFRITTDYRGLAAGGSFRYRLLADGRLVDSGEKKIDPFGEVTLSPKISYASADNIRIAAVVKRQDLTEFFWAPLLRGLPEWKVRYYPEGGDLVDSVPCQLAIGITDNTGNGVPARGRLLENGHPIAIFQTDDNGWARVYGCLFHKGRNYTVDFPEGPAHLTVKGSFPSIRTAGFVLHVRNGVARDSVSVELHFPVPGLPCRLLVYNEHEIAYAATIKALSSSARTTIPVKDWPAGLLTMTLLDTDGLPVAERKLYSPGPKVSVTILPDSTSYHTRSKVHLRIRTTDENGQGVSSIFSLSAVLASRLKQTGNFDIVRYAAIDQYLPEGPFPGTAPFYDLPSKGWDNDTTINLLLLTRGWTRYHWEAVTADSLPLLSGAPEADYGYVLQRSKRLHAALQMIVLGGNNGAGISIFHTDSAGRFRVPAVMLLSAGESDMALSLAGGDQMEQYRIALFNKYDSMNRRIAEEWYVPPPGLREDVLPDDKKDDKQDFRLARTLQKVVVTPHGNGSGSGGCKDYVCMMNVLNCPNHPYGRKPVIGETYRTLAAGNQIREVVYKGCQLAEPVFPPFVCRVSPIRLLKETYETDSSVLQSPTPALYTTLHWSPLLVTNKDGETAIDFYTNDLPGRYYNIVQGVSGQALLSGKQFFQVIKEKE